MTLQHVRPIATRAYIWQSIAVIQTQRNVVACTFVIIWIQKW